MAAAMMKLFCGTSLVLFLQLLVIPAEITDDYNLELVHILYRHGDRSPTHTFPTDEHQEKDWPQGFGQLTQVGMRQHYALGQYFRQRYIEGNPYKLLSERYNRTQIQVNSTNKDRTMMSAYSNLAGFFPPEGQQMWNPNITWQPVPVHTKPLYMDNVLNTDVDCPAAEQAYQNALKSPKIQQEENDNWQFYEYVSNKTGVQHEGISTIWSIFDALFCESKHNMSMPPWLNKTFGNQTVWEKMNSLRTLEFELKLGSHKEGRLRGGNLLGEVHKHIKAKIGKTEEQLDQLLYMYSAHDTTVAAFASAMNVYNGLAPPYAATVMVELYKSTSNSSYSVQVLFRNGTDLPYHILTVPGCTKMCPVEKFLDLTKDGVPVDWSRECQTPESGKVNGGLLLVIGIASGCAFLLIIVGILTGVFWKRRQRPAGYWGLHEHA